MKFDTLPQAQEAYDKQAADIKAAQDLATEAETAKEAAEKTASAALLDFKEAEQTATDLQADLAEALEKVTALEGEAAKLAEDLKEAQEKDMDVDRRAAALVAQSGGAPIEGGLEGEDGQEGQVISRKDFDALSHAERHAFFAKGGRLTVS